jgi:hypothetical protein
MKHLPPQELARRIVCDAAVAVLDAASVKTFSCKIQVAMNHATDRAIAKILRHDAETRHRTIKEIRARVYDVWADCRPPPPIQLEFELV